MRLLNVVGLQCGYGRDEVIHGVDFAVDGSEIVTVLGPNGCGKTTFVKAVLGYLRLSRGSITFNGKDITALRATERSALGMGYVPQLLNVFKPLTVMENLEMGGYRLTRRERERGLGRVLEIFPILRERSDQRAVTLSGGERQLLAMGRALMVEPELLFLDEPSAGLAPRRASEVFEHVQRVATLGTSIVIVEQDVHRALAISERGYVFVSGRVEFEGSAQSITQDERIRAAYLGGQGNVESGTAIQGS